MLLISIFEPFQSILYTASSSISKYIYSIILFLDENPLSDFSMYSNWNSDSCELLCSVIQLPGSSALPCYLLLLTASCPFDLPSCPPACQVLSCLGHLTHAVLSTWSAPPSALCLIASFWSFSPELKCHLLREAFYDHIVHPSICF